MLSVALKKFPGDRMLKDYFFSTREKRTRKDRSSFVFRFYLGFFLSRNKSQFLRGMYDPYSLPHFPKPPFVYDPINGGTFCHFLPGYVH